MPIFRECKVHRDFHIEAGKALYSIPKDYIGQSLEVRADSALVKMFFRVALIKTHPQQRPGGRSTDPADLPEHKVATRDLDRLITTAHVHGHDAGIYAERLLDDPLPWTRMQAVYRLIGLTRRYGDTAVDTACGRALEVDVISVNKIASMLEKAVENLPAASTRPAATGAARFARDPGKYAPRAHLRLVHNATATDGEQHGDER